MTTSDDYFAESFTLALETDFSLDHYLEKTTIIEDGKLKEKVDRIPLGSHLDDWIGCER